MNTQLVGVIANSDIVLQIGHCVRSACTHTADHIMTRDVVSCLASDGLPDGLPDVLSMMQASGRVHVPVVDTEGRPPGVVNARDALRELMLEGRYEEALLRDYVMGVAYR